MTLERPIPPAPHPEPAASLLDAIDDVVDHILILRALNNLGSLRIPGIVALSLVPVVLYVLFVGEATSLFSWLSAIPLCVILLIIFGGLVFGVEKVRDDAPAIELMLSPEDCQDLTNSMRQYYGPRGSQLWLSLVAVVLAWLLLIVGRAFGGTGQPILIDLGILGYFTFVVSNGAHWCWRFTQFIRRIACYALDLGILDPRRNTAIQRLKLRLQVAIALIWVELLCYGVVIWLLPTSPTTWGPGISPDFIGVFALEAVGLLVMIVILGRIGYALVLLGRAVRAEVAKRIAECVNTLTDIKKGPRSQNRTKLQKEQEVLLQELHRSAWSSRGDILIAIGSVLAQAILQVALFLINVSLVSA